MIAAGLICRLAPLGLPHLVVKYGGSAIWGAMVYFIVAALLPMQSPVFAGLLATLAAILSELFRLFHMPALDSFRETLAGALLLGRIFAVRNIVAYGVGISVATWFDSAVESLRARRQM
jgi:hypothetical protein